MTVEAIMWHLQDRGGNNVVSGTGPVAWSAERGGWETPETCYADPDRLLVFVGDLAFRQGTMWERIKSERDRRAGLGVKVGAHWFHSDPKSRIQQLGLVLLGPNLPAVQWKTLTFTPPPVFVTMTPALAQGIVVATAISDTAIFAAAEQHRLAMEISATPEAYDFTGGWPQTIEDEANAAGIQFNTAIAA